MKHDGIATLSSPFKIRIVLDDKNITINMCINSFKVYYTSARKKLSDCLKNYHRLH